ncbi:diacylglycerol kinase [Haloplasma contractile]|uniref:Diacylglycerol kinase protein n=1 Tax=Haloplasma contractile SSD-17B TaxID=1033810 RepID=U2EEJ1_9MOLU|nr:diacylglycerol kinase [Haloplasma contractile]ERJ13116.1 Diacylglycerol kinase protein [Haloplasma contractile SSD-17B]
MKRARLIYNPTSGKELIKKRLPYILERLEDAGYEASVHATKGPGCAKHAAETAVKQRYDLVIAAGGDGTIFEVVNGLAEKEYRPRLGLIPSGTTNDFARALEIPRNVKAACDIIVNGFSRELDIGKADDKYFVNIAAGGALSEVTYEVPSKLKTVLGSLAYYFRGIRKLPFMTPMNAHIEYDGHVYDGDIVLFLVCNTNSVGGFERLASKSKLDDGQFDLIIIEKMILPKLLGLGIQTLSGKHLKHAKIKYLKANSISISVERDVKLNLDGEYGGMLKGEFKNLKRHLEIYVPRTDNKHFSERLC